MEENKKIRDHCRRTARLMLRMVFRNSVIDDESIEIQAQKLCSDLFGIEKTEEIFLM